MTDLNTLSEDELGSAIESAGLRLAELARRRLAHQVRAAFPAAAAVRVEPIDTGGRAVLRVLDPVGAVLASADDDDDLDFGPQVGADIATVVLYGPQRPDQDGTLTVTFAPVFVAREGALDTVLAAARAAAGRIDGRFLFRDLMPVLDEVDRSRTWLVMAVKTLVDRGALQRVDGEAPGALAAGQDPQDRRPFLVAACLPQGGEAIRYQPVGQAAAETIVAQSMRHGSRVLAALDFDAFDADEAAGRAL